MRLDWDTFLSFTRHNFNGNADVALIPTIERHRQPVLVWSAAPQLPALVTDSAGKEATPGGGKEDETSCHEWSQHSTTSIAIG